MISRRIPTLVTTAMLGIALLAGPTTGPAVAHVPDSATTSAKSKTRTFSPQSKVITARSGEHRNYDRFVIELRGKAPGYLVRYVNSPRYDGSGDRIPIYGKRYLLVVLTPTRAHDNDGDNLYIGPRLRKNANLPTIKSFAFAGDFEGQVSFVLALRKKARFHVGELSNPRRLYIDIAH